MKTSAHNLAFIGAGYVGLVSGTCLADIGHNVILVDKDETKIDKLKQGVMPIYEPGLEELVEKNVQAGRLSFTTSLPEATNASNVIFIAVNTPSDEEGRADLSYVKAAAQEIAQHATSPKIIVNKSTVPVGTGDLVADILQKHNAHGSSFHVVSNPEFLREGHAIQDFMKGDRVVVGTDNEKAKTIMKEIYAPLGMPIFTTDIRSAELIKYASNSFLAMKISFINAVAHICEQTGGNIEDVAKGMGMDGRIGSAFLKAGCGWGGSCFPKDVSAFVSIAKDNGYDFDLLKSVINVNETSRNRFVQKIEHALGDVRGKKIGIWGLAFKPNTDDMRSAPSISVIHALHEKGAILHAYDPEAETTAQAVLGDKTVYHPDKYDAIKNADALVIMTEWDEFNNPQWDTIQSNLTAPIIVDGRNMFDPHDMKDRGFSYYSIGR